MNDPSDPRIIAPYTLFTRIPLYRHEGQYWTDELWEKDLREHYRYITNLRLCAPVIVDALPSGLAVSEATTDDNVTPMRLDRGWGSVFRNLLPNFLSVASALRKTKIAHSSGAGWAFPVSYYVLALRPVLDFEWIMVIESSFWMKRSDRRNSLRKRVGHVVHERLIRLALRIADVRIFTQDWYRETLLGTTERTLINPAVWVDEDQIASHEILTARSVALSDSSLPLIFPARLTEDKGTEVLF